MPQGFAPNSYRKKHMTSLTDYAKNLLSRSVVGRRPTLPAAVFVALGTGGSDATGLIGEPTGNGYLRQSVLFFGNGTQGNPNEIRFNFTAPPGTLTHIGIFDAQSTGNPLLWAPLATPATLNVPGVVVIPANSLTVVGD
jgi:hypothetical protein